MGEPAFRVGSLSWFRATGQRVARFLGGPSPPRGARAGILTYGLHDQVAALVKKYWNELRTGGASTLVNFGIVTGLLFTMSSPIGLLQQHIRICGHELGIGCPFIRRGTCADEQKCGGKCSPHALCGRQEHG